MPRATTRPKTTPTPLSGAADDADPGPGPDDTLPDLGPDTTDDDLGFVTLEQTTDKINVLYYGKEGSGKTTYIASMANLPEPGKVLIVNTEAGLKRRALELRGIDTSRIVVWPRPGVRATKDLLQALYRKLRADLEADPQSWLGIGFDSVTEVATLFRENATAARQAQLRAANRTFDPDFIDRADYGVQSDHVKRLLRAFRDLPCHFAMTALERIDDDGMVGPDVNPAVASGILGYPDLVLYCRATVPTVESDEDDLPEFRAATRSGSRYRAKDRFGYLPKVLADPTLPRIAAYIDGSLTEDQDTLQTAYLERAAARQAQAEADKAEREARKAKTKKTAGKPAGTDTKEN